jgi:hypothetical protein
MKASSSRRGRFALPITPNEPVVGSTDACLNAAAQRLQQHGYDHRDWLSFPTLLIRRTEIR